MGGWGVVIVPDHHHRCHHSPSHASSQYTLTIFLRVTLKEQEQPRRQSLHALRVAASNRVTEGCKEGWMERQMDIESQCVMCVSHSCSAQHTHAH